MALTPETLARHELNGLRVAVVEAANPDLVGISGRVVLETMRTLHVDSDASGSDRDGARVRQVPKEGATFRFRIPEGDAHTLENRGDASPKSARTRRGDDAPQRTDEAAGRREAPGTTSELDVDAAVDAGEGAVYVTVDGARLLSRPAQRTEQIGDSTWR